MLQCGRYCQIFDMVAVWGLCHQLSGQRDRLTVLRLAGLLLCKGCEVRIVSPLLVPGFPYMRSEL
jgi:hypothetical protein